MFRRNFDFFALAFVLMGFFAIERVPRVPLRIAARSVAVHAAMDRQGCQFDRVVTSLARFRSEFR